ncbi:MAG: MazG-like family protein [Clostridiaceae bacterium]
MRKDEFNIMSSVKIVEELKADLICVIGDFFKLLTKGTNVAEKALLDCISGAIILMYVLANRLGHSFVSIDEHMKLKLKEGIVEGDAIEKNGKDLSKLYTHLRERN